MRDLKTIFGFELNILLRKTSIRVTTIITVVILFGVTFIPRFLGPDVFGMGSASQDNVTSTDAATGDEDPSVVLDKKYGLVLSEAESTYGDLLSTAPFNQMQRFDDVADLDAAITAEDIDAGIVLHSPTSFEQVVPQIGITQDPTAEITAALTQYQLTKNYEAAGLDPATVAAAQNVNIQSTMRSLGGSQVNGLIFGMFGVFIVYILVLMYGQAVATSVAREKDDRTMELLITNTTPTKLITGKVFACTVVSFIQVALMLIGLAAGLFINIAYYPPFLVDMVLSSFQPAVIVTFLVYLVAGCFLYYFLYAALGALVNRVEDVNSAVSPVMFVFIGAYLLAYNSLLNPGGSMMRISSLIPFTSLLSMFARVAMVGVPLVELVLGFVLLIATTAIMAIIAIRIYRLGSLNYGNRMGFLKALRLSFRKEDA